MKKTLCLIALLLTFSLFAACTPQETASTQPQDVIRSSGQPEADVSADGSDSVQGVPSDTDVPVSTGRRGKRGKQQIPPINRTQTPPT